MKEKLAKIREEILKQIDASENLDKLNEVRVSALGKKGALTELLKSMKEVAPQERPKVGQMVNEVRAEIETALETEKCKAGVFFRIDIAHLEYLGMYHTAAQDFNPTGALTEPAALTAALKAADIYFRTGLCKREMMGTEFYFGIFAEQLFCKLCKRAL